MTYEAGGRQYVVIAAGGHGGLGTKPGDDLMAYALPAQGMTSGANTPSVLLPQCCTRTPSITTVDTVLLPGRFESSQSRRSVPLSQRLRFIL